MTPPQPPRPSGGSFRAFRHRKYLSFWSAALISNIGAWLSNLTVPYVIFQITGSALLTGFATVAQFLPSFVLGPVAGWLADRYDRRMVLLFTQSGMAVTAIALWLLWSNGFHNIWALLALVGLQGIVQGLNMPAWQSFVHDLVPRSDLASAVALNSLQFNAARSIGPMIAGAIITVLGPAGSFGLNAVSYVAVLTVLFIIRADGSQSHGQPTGNFLTAARYLLSQPGLVLSVVVAILVSSLINPVMQFTVVFAGSVFEVGAWPLGLMNGAVGIGALLVVPFVAGSAGFSRADTVRLGLLLMGVGMVGFAVSPNWMVVSGALIILGAGFLASISATNTAIQLIVAEPFRGRVMAVRIMLYTLSYPVGALIMGAVSDRVGPRPVVLGAAAIMLLAWALMAFRRRTYSLNHLDDPYDDSFDGPSAQSPVESR